MKYYYEFLNEKINKEYIDKLVNFNDKDFICNVIVTDKNILFFQDITRDNVLKYSEALMLPAEYRLVFKETLDNITKEFDENNTIIKTKNNNEIVIFNTIIT